MDGPLFALAALPLVRQEGVMRVDICHQPQHLVGGLTGRLIDGCERGSRALFRNGERIGRLLTLMTLDQPGLADERRDAAKI